MPWRTNCWLLVTVSLLALACPTPSPAADGSLKIRFTLDGEAPKPTPAYLHGSDEAFCASKSVVYESLVVGPKKQIQNVVMWLVTPPDQSAPHSEAAIKALPKEVQLQTRNCRYEPHITLLHTSQTLVISNPDPIGHAAKVDLFRNPSFNELIPVGDVQKREFKEAENRPAPISTCAHLWMSGFLLVRDNPYFGVSNAEGVLTIPHIPAGKHSFVIWHERTSYVTRGTLSGEMQEFQKGKLEVTVAGETDLGEMIIPLKLLDK